MSSENDGRWVEVPIADKIELEEVSQWDFEGHSYAIYRSPEDEYYATEDICTHEHAHLSAGYVEDNTIECPRHAGRFCYKTGEALGAPVCIDLKTYPIRIVDGKVELQLS